MKLSARIILYHLRQKYKVTASPDLSPDPCLEYPLLWTPGEAFQPGRIYLTDCPDAISAAGELTDTLLLVSCPSAFLSGAAKTSHLCILEEGTSLQEALAFLQAVFFRYSSWNQELFQLMLEQPSVQKILEQAKEVIPNPMMVIGLDFTVIASRDYGYSQLQDSVLGATEETQALINSLKYDENYTEAVNYTGYFLYPGNQLVPPSLCVNISPFGTPAYRFHIFSGEMPLDDTFGFLAQYLAGMISRVMSLKSSSQRPASHPLHQIFHTLLTDPKADYVEISRQLTENRWLSSHTYQCALIRTSPSDRKNRTLKSICTYVENTIPASCALEHREDIVVYINLDLCPLTLDECFQKLAFFVRDSMLIAGYSRKMLGHFNFHRQYVQAFASIQTGSRINPTSWIHHFNDIALPYMLEQITRSLPAYMTCHERLLQLKYQDQDGSSQLYQTLRCYLENQQSATKTAAALFIHRSTLLYRLEKIQKFLRSDLSSPDEQLYLLLSFHLMEQEDQRKR